MAATFDFAAVPAYVDCYTEPGLDVSPETRACTHKPKEDPATECPDSSPIQPTGERPAGVSDCAGFWTPAITRL